MCSNVLNRGRGGVTSPVTCAHCDWDRLVVGGGEILLDQCVQWGNSLFFCVFIQQGSERVPGMLVLLSLRSDTDDSLFWHSSRVARFLSSIHALVCLVDKASQVSLHQHHHLTAQHFTPHGRLSRSQVMSLLTQTMWVNKTQRCFGLWEMSFL